METIQKCILEGFCSLLSCHCQQQQCWHSCQWPLSHHRPKQTSLYCHQHPTAHHLHHLTILPIPPTSAISHIDHWTNWLHPLHWCQCCYYCWRQWCNNQHPSPQNWYPFPWPHPHITYLWPSNTDQLSMMEQLIHNNLQAHATLWTMDALNQYHVQNWSTTLHLPLENHPETDIFPCCLTTFNLPNAQHDGLVQLLATLTPPAPDSSKQPCHIPSHHPPGQAPGPTCNLHPHPTTLMHHHHHLPYLPLATNIKALAHNMQLP